MELKDADFEKFSEWNEKTIRKEWESARYGITESERKNLKRLFGYDGSKPSSRAGGFTFECLELGKNDLDSTKSMLPLSKNDSIDRFPTIFNQVM